MYQICQSIPLWLQRNVTGIGSTEPAAKQLVIWSGRAVPLLHFLMPLNVLLLMLKRVKSDRTLRNEVPPRKDWTPLWCGFTAKNLKIHSCGFRAKWGKEMQDLKPALGNTFLLHGYFPCNWFYLRLNTREWSSLPEILLSLNSRTQAIGTRNASCLTAVGEASLASLK